MKKIVMLILVSTLIGCRFGEIPPPTTRDAPDSTVTVMNEAIMEILLLPRRTTDGRLDETPTAILSLRVYIDGALVPGCNQDNVRAVRREYLHHCDIRWPRGSEGLMRILVDIRYVGDTDSRHVDICQLRAEGRRDEIPVSFQPFERRSGRVVVSTNRRSGSSCHIVLPPTI